LCDGAEEVASSRLVHLDNDLGICQLVCECLRRLSYIITLAIGNVEPLSGVWGDGNVISGNDRHLVVVEVNGPAVLGSTVDETESVLLASLNTPKSVLATRQIWESVVAVEHVVPGVVRTEVSNAVILRSSSENLSSIAEEVVNHDSTGINVVVCSSRAVNDHRTADTITKLAESVGVVPTGAVLAGLEAVGAGVARGDSTLSDTWNTVLIVGAVLDDTVPMNLGLSVRLESHEELSYRSSIVLHLVGDMDLDPVTPVALDGGTGHLAVDSQSKAVNTIVVEGGIGDDPIVSAGLARIRAGGVVVRVDVEATAPLRSVTGAVAAVVAQRRERLCDVGSWCARSRAAAVLTRAAAAWVVVFPASISWSSTGRCSINIGGPSPCVNLAVLANDVTARKAQVQAGGSRTVGTICTGTPAIARATAGVTA
jgi:hypothetical protein